LLSRLEKWGRREGGGERVLGREGMGSRERNSSSKTPRRREERNVRGGK